MTYGLLTPDVPLGPFEGAPVTVWSTQGKQAKLHASRSCSYLRSARVTERGVRLDASTVGRMCPQCAGYGSWARPGTGLGIFLHAVTGLGLLYEMDSYCEVGEETCSDAEVEKAASLLSRPLPDSPETTTAGASDEAEDEDETAWEELQEARRVREFVFDEWLSALASLYRVHHVLDLFPWLRSWAAVGVQRKAARLETLRVQAERLVARHVLMLAAAVSARDEPVVPADDPAFAPLGAPAEVGAQLTSLWRRWRSKVEDSWEHPREQGYLVHHLRDGMGSRRKGQDQMLERARVLLGEWEGEAARSVVAGEADGERVLTARLAGGSLPARGSGESLGDRLSEWERGVLVSYMVATDWQQSAITVRVPEPVAARLLSQQSVFFYEEPAPVASETVGEPALREDRSGLGYGVFDDTPVNSRRLVTLDDLRALRSTMRDPEQLYVVLGVEAGVEVVPLSVLEKRCAAGWQGVIIAGASDLPDVLFGARQQSVSESASQNGGVWADHVADPHDEAFGRSLSMAEGERVLVLLCEGRRDVGHALRSLALARTVADLRELEAAGYDDRGSSRSPFAPGVWNGLLAMEQLDLEPFEPDSETDWPRGSGLPLGVLAQVQVYTTDATGRYQGRAHSPGCPHRRPLRGVSRDDDRVTVEELLGSKGFDPCSKCGGYAVRRLTDAQVTYYRAAHRLHDLAQRTRAAGRHGTADTGELAKALEELGDLDVEIGEAWFLSSAQAGQWRRIVHGLRRELPEPASD